MSSPMCICNRLAKTVSRRAAGAVLARSSHAGRSSVRMMSMARQAGSSSRTVLSNTTSSMLHRPMLPQRNKLPTFFQATRSMFVQTETTPNEDSLKFIPGEPLSTTGQTHEFLSSQDARSSPLASALFDIPGVKMVFFGPDFISVNKTEDTQWALLKPEIYSVIIEHFSQGKPLFFEGRAEGEGPEDTRILDTDSEVVAMVKELLDTRVRPAIQEDGGDIEYKGFNEDSGIVTVSLKGSCRGCDSSTVTLKSGIERMLMHYIPEVKGVEQVISAEEAIAADEFAKFEARLRSEGKTVEI